MKLVLAIINHDDANTVIQNLTKHGFSSTKLATTGGFLMSGNVTILIGVDEEKVQDVIDIIREHSHSRKQMIPTTTEMGYGYYPSMPVEVTVGGATIFVVDIERFERV
ncbi:MAG: cyclic-di-AMP receptor [Oscillospiraceae bacterium]